MDIWNAAHGIAHKACTSLKDARAEDQPMSEAGAPGNLQEVLVEAARQIVQKDQQWNRNI
jgi:hypothetical protein